MYSELGVMSRACEKTKTYFKGSSLPFLKVSRKLKTLLVHFLSRQQGMSRT